MADEYLKEFSDEMEARTGLDISHYPYRWKSAQELALKNERTDDFRLLPYWERVRVLYLELGGEFLDRHRE